MTDINIDEKESLRLIIEERTCPPYNVLMAGGPDIEEHLRHCQSCQNIIKSDDGRYSEISSLTAHLPECSPRETVKVGELRQVRSDAVSSHACGWHNPPIVLVIEDENKTGMNIVRVVQVCAYKNLIGPGDIFLSFDNFFAECWNSWYIQAAHLGKRLGNVKEAEVNEIFKNLDTTTPWLPKHSLIDTFRSLELRTADFYATQDALVYNYQYNNDILDQNSKIDSTAVELKDDTHLEDNNITNPTQDDNTNSTVVDLKDDNACIKDNNITNLTSIGLWPVVAAAGAAAVMSTEPLFKFVLPEKYIEFIKKFFLNKKLFLEETDAFLERYPDSLLSKEELYEKYEKMVLSKLDCIGTLEKNHKTSRHYKLHRCIFNLNTYLELSDHEETTLLNLTKDQEDNLNYLATIRKKWMASAFRQKYSDERRSISNSPANIYHRIQLMIKDNRSDFLYYQGKWYGRPNLGIPYQFDNVPEIEKTYIYLLPPIKLYLRDFYSKNGKELRFPAFGKTLDYVQEEVEKKSNSKELVFKIYQYIRWLFRYYELTSYTVMDEQEDGSKLSDSNQLHYEDYDDIMEKIFLYVKEQTEPKYKILLKLKIERKSFEEIQAVMRQHGLKFDKPSGLSYHFGKIKNTINQACKKYGVYEGKKAIEVFIDYCQINNLQNMLVK